MFTGFLPLSSFKWLCQQNLDSWWQSITGESCEAKQCTGCFCFVFPVLSDGDMAILEVGHLQTLLIGLFIERFFIFWRSSQQDLKYSVGLHIALQEAPVTVYFPNKTPQLEKPCHKSALLCTPLGKFKCFLRFMESHLNVSASLKGGCWKGLCRRQRGFCFKSGAAFLKRSPLPGCPRQQASTCWTSSLMSFERFLFSSQILCTHILL